MTAPGLPSDLGAPSVSGASSASGAPSGPAPLPAPPEAAFPATPPLVGVVMGSDSDWPVMQAAAAALEEFARSEEHTSELQSRP